jgi:2-keto-4-pentenoate hydratase/2-oxohepta-3-ene-1,7-dioic acid hydratase in catechol pathway
MRLVTFRPRGAAMGARLGVMLDDDNIVDLTAATAVRLRDDGMTELASLRVAAALVPGDMTEFLEGGALALQAARETLAWTRYRAHGEDDPGSTIHRRADVRLLAPVQRPPTLRDGNFFEEHTRNAAAQLGAEISPAWYAAPAYYKGTRASIGGPDDPLEWPEPSERVDFEFEYAVVIGRPGRDIPQERALEHVVGYTILNDFSARDLQAREMPTLMGPAKGKDFDGGTVLGPYLVTVDEAPAPESMTIVGRLNGEAVCEARAGAAYWTWPQVIAHISRSETLLPGDVIGSGTVPRGSMFERGGPWLKPGDVVEEEVTGLGVLRTVLRRTSTEDDRP